MIYIYHKEKIMIDLHIHSDNSDGSDSVEEILKKAQKIGLNCISITDHNNCDAYDILKNLKVSELYGGKIIKGIELKCTYKGRIIDVLGYNYNVKKMKKMLGIYYPQHSILQEKYLNHFYSACEKMNLKLTPIQDLKWDKDKDWATILIYNEIKKYPENEEKCPKDMWKSLDSFRYNYLYNKKSDFYIDKTKDYPTLEECISIIHKAKGKAFIAHIYIYNWAQDKKKFINEMVDNYDIDGIECYYTKFSDEQINYVLKLCDEKELCKSGGCDYHGVNKPGISIGVGYGNLKIPDYIMDEWNKEKWYEKIFRKRRVLLEAGGVIYE